MSEMNFLAGFVADDVTPLEAAQITSGRQDAAEARHEAQAQAERAAQAQDRADAMAFAEKQHGNPLAELSRARNVLMAADDEYRDAEARFRKAEGKVRRARENVEFFAQRAAQVQEVAQRSAAPSDDPVEQAARVAHRLFTEATRARMNDAALGRPPKARRPFASGLAARSESTPDCPDCAGMGATAEESFAIHHPELLQDADVEQERRSYGGPVPMIYR
jgi:hypothetical protein